MIPLYKALIRPILEYMEILFGIRLLKSTSIRLFKGIQRRYTKKVTGHSDLSYEERLKSLKLPSLEYHRMRGDLTEVYKILHYVYDPSTTQSLLTLSHGEVTRGHDFKLTKRSTNTRLFQLVFFY